MDYYPYNYVPNDAFANPFSIESYYNNNKQFTRNMSAPYMQSYPYSAFGNVDYYYPENYYNEPQYNYDYPSYMGHYNQQPQLYYGPLPRLDPFLYQFNPLDVEYLRYVHNKGKREGMKMSLRKDNNNNNSDVQRRTSIKKKTGSVIRNADKEKEDDNHVGVREKRILLKVKELDNKGVDIEEIMARSLGEKLKTKKKKKSYYLSKELKNNSTYDNNRYSGLPNIEKRLQFNNVVHNPEKEENEKNMDKLGLYQMKYSYGFRIAKLDKSDYIKPSAPTLKNKQDQTQSLNMNESIQAEQLKLDLKGDTNVKFPNIDNHRYQKQDNNEDNVNYDSFEKERQINENKEQVESKVFQQKKKKKPPKKEESKESIDYNENKQPVNKKDDINERKFDGVENKEPVKVDSKKKKKKKITLRKNEDDVPPSKIEKNEKDNNEDVVKKKKVLNQNEIINGNQDAIKNKQKIITKKPKKQKENDNVRKKYTYEEDESM